MILLQYADLHDLDVFFREGYKLDTTTTEAVEVYNFSAAFPDLRDDKLHPALIRQVWGVASALQRLHDELQIFGGNKKYVAHMDIKPDNILLIRDARSPVGRFLLSDFGISRFEKIVEKTNPDASSPPEGTSRTKKKEKRWCPATYRPPEAGDPGVDGRKYDVWSFGCVLVDILAFATGREAGVKRLRALRCDGHDDFYYNSHAGKVEDRHGARGELKNSVAEWLDGCASNAHPYWSAQYIRIIRAILVRNPSERPSMKEVMESLDKFPRCE